MVVIDRIVQHRPIIPKRNTSRLPPESARKFRPYLMLEQVPQQWLALVRGPAIESNSMGDVDVQVLPACLGMRSNRWMTRLEIGALRPGVFDAIFTRLRRVCFRRATHAVQRRERRLQAIGKSIVGCGLVCEECIATIWWDLSSKQYRPLGRLSEICSVGMPDAAKVDRLVFLFEDLDDFWEAINAFDEGIFDRLTELRCEVQKLLRREILLPEEDHLVLEERLMYLLDGSVVEGAKVDVVDLGTQRASNASDLDVVMTVLHRHDH